MSVAAAAASLVASTSLSVHDHLRLRCFRLHPRPPPPLRFRQPLRDCLRLVLAVLEEKPSSAPAEEDAREYGLNGSASGRGYDDASVEAYLGSNGNGSGNGAAVKPAVSESSAALVSASAPGEDERRRKERVEEIFLRQLRHVTP